MDRDVSMKRECPPMVSWQLKYDIVCGCRNITSCVIYVLKYVEGIMSDMLSSKLCIQCSNINFNMFQKLTVDGCLKI